MRGIVKLILSIFICLLFANADASPAADWEAPINLSEDGASSVSAVVKGGPNGTSYAVWSRFDGQNYIIQSAILDESGHWSPAENISLTGNDAFFADLTIDRKENVIAVWSQKQDSLTVIQASHKFIGEEWSTPVTLSGNEVGSGNASLPLVVLGPKDEVYAIWQKKLIIRVSCNFPT